ncbi:MAG: DUF3099 domain-containing protein [Actinomycetota bacterium]|nr:DUF3099 domain-containing protein [Actinomycetota bacterium]
MPEYHTPTRESRDAGPLHPSVQSVTDVPSSVSADRADRARRYLTAMGLRGICFVLAIVTTGWLRWTFVAGAVILPYVAVVLANAVGPRTSGVVTRVDPRSKQTRALTGTVHDGPVVDGSGPQPQDDEPRV